MTCNYLSLSPAYLMVIISHIKQWHVITYPCPQPTSSSSSDSSWMGGCVVLGASPPPRAVSGFLNWSTARTWACWLRSSIWNATQEITFLSWLNTLRHQQICHHFQMHFLVWKVFWFRFHFVLLSIIDNKSFLVHAMAWQRERTLFPMTRHSFKVIHTGFIMAINSNTIKNKLSYTVSHYKMSVISPGNVWSESIHTLNLWLTVTSNLIFTFILATLCIRWSWVT